MASVRKSIPLMALGAVLCCLALAIYCTNARNETLADNRLGSETLSKAPHVKRADESTPQAPPVDERVSRVAIPSKEQPSPPEKTERPSQDGERLKREDKRQVRFLARKLAVGDGFEQLEEPVLTKVKDALAKSESALTESRRLMNEAKDACVDQKIARCEYDTAFDQQVRADKGILAAATRQLDNGKLVRVLVRTGDSAEFEEARKLYTRVLDQRTDEVQALLESGMKQEKEPVK